MSSALSLDLWRRLYDLAERIWRMKPWGWMREAQLFAVRDPEDPQRLGFVSVMGAGGEFPAISVYLGREALLDFRQVVLHPEEVPLEEAARRLMLIPQLMLTFARPDELASPDLEVMQQLGVATDREVLPAFRSQHPAHYLWFLEEDEARFLAVALEQTLEVAPLVREGQLHLHPDDHPRYYVRTMQDADGGRQWVGVWEKIEPPPLRRVRFSLPETLIEEAAALPQGEDVLEVQMELAVEIGPLQDQPQQRPYFPYLFVSVHLAQQPQIVDAQLVRPDTPSRLAESFARLLLKTLHQLGRRPREVRMAPRAHYVQVAQWLSAPLNFRVRVEPLEALPGAWAFLVNKQA